MSSTHFNACMYIYIVLYAQIHLKTCTHIHTQTHTVKVYTSLVQHYGRRQTLDCFCVCSLTQLRFSFDHFWASSCSWTILASVYIYIYIYIYIYAYVGFWSWKYQRLDSKQGEDSEVCLHSGGMAGIHRSE
jgi:hypothetical protein